MLEKTQNEIMENWPEDWTRPMVTIRCLVYNHEKYLSQALDGFLMQKTDFPFEIFVHDDASTDHSAEIIRRYEERYPRIIKPIYESENLYSKKNGSLRKVVNSLQNNRGRYIALCEGDDYWVNPLKLQKQVSFLERNGEYFGCVGGSSVLYENTGLVCRREKKYPPFDLPLKYFIRATVGHTSTIVVRREILEQVEAAPRVFSGDKLWLLLMKLNGKVAFLPEQFSIYRKHDGGASRNVKLQWISRDLQLPDWAKKIYEHRTGKKYPYFRHLSFIYYTIFCYSTDLSFFEKVKFFSLYLLTSFSYFPKNLWHMARMAKVYIQGKRFT